MASSSLQHSLKLAMPILNKVSDSNIALKASFVTAVGNSNSYALNGLFFLNYSPFWCG